MADDFAALHSAELKDLGLTALDSKAYGHGADGSEPYVRETPNDVVGLCLSGGGIRSATFNLGVLQALSKLGLLERFHYLSTVSGGGYIGAWWTSVRRRRPDAKIHEIPDEREVRHLREFSNFLAPRVGATQSETGSFAVSGLAAILPSLVASASVLVLMLWTLDRAEALLRSARADGGLWLVGIATFAALLEFERRWSKAGKADPADRAPFMYVVAAAGASLFAAFVWRKVHVPQCHAGLGWVAACALIATARFAASRFFSSQAARTYRAAIDRVAARLLLFAGAALAFAVVWRIGEWLHARTGPVMSWTLPGGLTVAAVLTWAKSLVTSVGAEPSKAKSGKLTETLRKLLPQLIAWGVVAAGGVAVVALLLTDAASAPPWYRSAPAIALAVVVLVALLFDPAEVGLHAAYRTRIARAYLGVVDGDRARRTDETAADDIEPCRMPEGIKAAEPPVPANPVHLVCCAANDVAGDPLENLGRGARSAVLSRHGFGVGNAVRRWKGDAGEPTLAGAVTASAAAFNSVMGAASVEMGPAVTFIMASLDLRLGLWLPHPHSSGRITRVLPGAFLALEMLSRTWVKQGRPVHLSDGGHFENLGLYELVRRHVRYIVVCDCGQDVDVAFDDLGNALRRVRADFGVEIRLDVSALRPGPDGVARSHVAVGDIEYPEGDRGVIVLLKPSITGDEPDDVLQYRARNTDFPNESTGDQFYDHAQWESYRRLGRHVAETAFVPAARRGRPGSDGALFAEMRQEWYPTPAGFDAAYLDLTERCHQIESGFRDAAPAALMRQVYPEIAPAGGTTAIADDEWPVVVSIVQQIGQLIEDVWVGCQLDDYPFHPLNLGWVNYFHRWASAPAFRALWPTLRTIWSPGTRRFVEERLGLGPAVDPSRLYTFSGSALAPTPGVAWKCWTGAGTQPAETDEDAQDRWFDLDLNLPGGKPVPRIQVAVLRVVEDRAKREIRMTDDDLFVVPGLWGAGVGTRLLRSVIDALRKEAEVDGFRFVASIAKTRPTPSEKRTDVAGAADRRASADKAQFYVSLGFRLTGKDRETLELTL
jgi:GNAT superfamily N-acetyltransferase